MCDNIIASGQPWTDPDFNGQAALWKNDEYHKRGMERDHDAWSKKLWKRAGEIRPNFKLFGSTIDPTDIQQGGIGDCYFVSSVASLAERPSRVRALFYNKETNDAGCYLIKFYVNGNPKGVMVDDLFLVDGSNLIFA